MTLLPPAESMRVAATILLKNIELKHTNNTNSSIRSQIEVHVKFCYYLFCILLFACLVYCSKMNSTYSCRSLFCFVFVVVVLFLFQFLFVFFISFGLSSSVLSCCIFSSVFVCSWMIASLDCHRLCLYTCIAMI